MLLLKIYVPKDLDRKRLIKSNCISLFNKYKKVNNSINNFHSQDVYILKQIKSKIKTNNLILTKAGNCLVIGTKFF